MSKKKKAVRKKKRASKYDKKLIVNASFDQVMNLSTLDMPKKK